jgi:fructose-bisphosphate aldolase, class I
MTNIVELLGEEVHDLLEHQCRGIPRDLLHLPGPDFVERVMMDSDRKPGVLRALQTLIGHGRLAGTGYLSILPVDQGVEHSGGASFAPNPLYFDPENIVRLAMEGGCNAVASTLRRPDLAESTSSPVSTPGADLSAGRASPSR